MEEGSTLLLEPSVEIQESSVNIKQLLKRIVSKLLSLYIFLNTNLIVAIIILVLVVGTTVSLVVVSVLFYPVRIDFSLRAFEVPNHVASLRYDSFVAVKEDLAQHRNKHKNTRAKRENDFIVKRTQRHRKWKLDIIYIAEDGNIFTPDKLSTIHKIEVKLLKDQQFQKFCWRSYLAFQDVLLRDKFNGCMPPNSLIGYFYRTNYYDGLGSELSDIPGTLDFLLSRSSTFWYVDENFSRDNKKSRLLRTQINFGVPLEGYEQDTHFSSLEKQHRKFKSFIVNFVDHLKKASSRQVKILYGSPEIYDYQVMSTFQNDLMLAIASFILILCLVFMLSSFSLWLTICGILSIILSVPLAYFFYRVCLGMKTVGILTGASIFVIIGIGVDDVFVFINVYKQSLHIKDEKKHMIYTISTAGKATFFTSFTTAAAFGANVLSKIPAVHDFGLYSCIVVMACWIIVMLIMPPSLTLWRILFRKCENLICFCQSCSKRNRSSNIFQSEEQLIVSHELTENPMEETDLSITTDLVFHEVDVGDGWHNTANSRPSNDKPCCTLSILLQNFLTKWVAQPILKGRYIVIILFIIISCTSVFLTTRLHSAKGRPELFSADSNLQKLLDLKYNLSAEDYDCTSCSGLYSGISVVPNSNYNPVEKLNTGRDQEVFRKARLTTPNQHFTTAALTVGKSTTNRPTTSRNQTTLSSTASTKLSSQKASEENAINQIIPTNWHEHREPEEHRSVSTRKAAEPPVHNSGENKKSVKLCPTPSSCKPAERPILDKTALVYVVFGVKGVDRSTVSKEHVIEEKGTPIYDESFTILGTDLTSAASGQMISALCKVCTMIESNRELVKPGGGDCFPEKIYYMLKYSTPYKYCKELKMPKYVNGKKSLSIVHMLDNKVKSIAMAFESTTFRGKSAFDVLKDYQNWEKYLTAVLADRNVSKVPSLRTGFQTSSTWVKMFSEVIAVNGAVYGTITSIVMCFAAVIVFTGNASLTGAVFLTIVGILCAVLALFYLAGWQLGAVEAVSLSILVGTSVDYTVHLVEGYILSCNDLDFTDVDNKQIRMKRTKAAVSHIGVSILSSAVTTITAAIPLCFTEIQLFAKFGQILAMNTAVSIVYTLTVGVAFLSTFGPSRYYGSIKSRCLAAVVVIGLTSSAVFVLYVMSKFGHVSIPGPSGDPIFN